MKGEVIPLRGLPLDRRLAALRRMLEHERERITIAEEQCRRLVREINRGHAAEARERGHSPLSDRERYGD